ncbi:MAG: WbqC family protein [Runella sp.]
MPLVVASHYLPSIEYFVCLLQYMPHIEWEAHENYIKQTYRNRCHILTANGVEALTVPVQHTAPKIPIREVRVDYSQLWYKRHWRAIVSAYAKAPYFEYFAPDFEKVYQSKPTFLWDLNEELLRICSKLLQIELNIAYTPTYQVALPEGWWDMRGKIHPKNESYNNFFQPAVYQQNFGNQFYPNLSIIDLLMCKGREAKSVLEKSAFKTTLE